MKLDNYIKEYKYILILYSNITNETIEKLKIASYIIPEKYNDTILPLFIKDIKETGKIKRNITIFTILFHVMIIIEGLFLIFF